MHDLKVWPGVEADGQHCTSTPGKSTAGEDQMSRLAKVHVCSFTQNQKFDMFIVGVIIF